MANVTAPGKPESSRPAPGTRRAARAMRDEAERRARAEKSTPAATSAPSEHGAPSENGAPPAGTRRAARAAGLFDSEAVHARHARTRRWKRAGVVAGLAVGAALLVGSSAALTAMVAPPADTVQAKMSLTGEPPDIEQLPVPEVRQAPVVTDLCAIPEFAAALQSGDDEAAVLAAGGGEAFRSAVAEGSASCVDLGDSTRVWAVVDKLRPASPIDYRPSALVMPEGVRNIEGGALRADAASALTSLVAAARDAGVGEIALESAFRSYRTQQETYARHFAERGEQADQVSARPGHSEHQLGLGVDVVPCAGACGTLDDLAGTAQGQWIAAHAWEHGWIVRYVDGATAVTGYLPEPWHLRYVGRELARAYHEGGWRSLEEFFALPPAPDYAE